MATFPLLRTGVIAQYPLQVSMGQRVQIIRFLDGSDQRFLSQGRQFRRWEIKLDLLDEQELAAVEQFFIEQQGTYSTFTFPDPVSGQAVQSCRLGSSGLVMQCAGTELNSTSLWVVETNG